jgi:hypothetical protein
MKIISIAASEQGLYVLTDDGEVWFWRQDKWKKLTPLSEEVGHRLAQTQFLS